MVFFVLLSWALATVYLAYMLLIRQTLSSYKHLPTAKQPSLWRRLLHEPTPFELRSWMRETPNDGLIRFFGFLNQERLLLTSSENMKQVLQRDAQNYDKLPWFGSLQSAAGVSGLVSSEGDLHKAHRKVIIGAFNDLSTRHVAPAMWPSVLRTIEALQSSISGCKIVKVNTILQLACLDTSLHAAFGIDVDVLSNPQQPFTRGYLRPFQLGERSPLYMKLLHICPVRLQLPAVTLISRMMGVNVWRMRALMAKEMKHKLQIIRNQKYDRVDAINSQNIMDGLLRRGYQRLSERVLVRHLMTTMAANTEMVSNQLSWAIYALSHPSNLDIQSRLRKEIRTQFRELPMFMSWEELNNQKYLSGVVNEILRVYPNVGHRGRVVNRDTMLHNLHLKKGTIVVWPVCAKNRDPQHWGQDADMFKPERWLLADGTGKDTEYRDTFGFMTFGQGSRKCPGEHYTRAAMASMLIGLIGRFEFRRPDGYHDVLEDGVGGRIKFGIVMKADIWAEIKEIPGWGDFR